MSVSLHDAVQIFVDSDDLVLLADHHQVALVGHRQFFRIETVIL